jgi:hypothetical protein
MIIDLNSYTRNEDIRTFVDFIYRYGEKNLSGFLSEWIVLLVHSRRWQKERALDYGNYTLQVFRALVGDAALADGSGAELYRRSVINAIAGWDETTGEFTDEEVRKIFTTVQYFEEDRFAKTLDTDKIYAGRISTVSWIYQFVDPAHWAVYNPRICFVLEKFAQDFWKTNPEAAERLGDLIRFPSPVRYWGMSGDPLEDARAPIKLVQASLLLRCLADTLSEKVKLHHERWGSGEGTWEICHVEIALSNLSSYFHYVPPEEDYRLHPPPAGTPPRLTLME